MPRALVDVARLHLQAASRRLVATDAPQLDRHAGAARDMADSPEQVLHLEGVLGCTTAPNAVHAVDPETVFYLAGNVGVLYHVPSKTQTLLRGHVSLSSCAPARLSWDVIAAAVVRLAAIRCSHPAAAS